MFFLFTISNNGPLAFTLSRKIESTHSILWREVWKNTNTFNSIRAKTVQKQQAYRGSLIMMGEEGKFQELIITVRSCGIVMCDHVQVGQCGIYNKQACTNLILTVVQALGFQDLLSDVIHHLAIVYIIHFFGKRCLTIPTS